MHSIGRNDKRSVASKAHSSNQPVSKQVNHQFFNVQARYVFFISAPMVIGPTPPGTGVIHEHLGATVSYCTSPFNLNPLFFVASSTRVMPTSMTTAPSYTISAVTNSALPNAATIISACRQSSFRFFVCE